MTEAPNPLPPPRPGYFYVENPGQSAVKEVSIAKLRESRRNRQPLVSPKVRVSVDGVEWLPLGDVRRLSPDISFDVFISFAGDDYQIAQSIRAKLRNPRHGIDSYLGPKNIRSSPDWTKELTAAINASLVVVLLASAKAAKSKWVKTEILFAIKTNKPIIPFRIDETPARRDDDMEFTLASYQWIETGGEWPRHFRRLKRYIGLEIGIKEPRESLTVRIRGLLGRLAFRLRRTSVKVVRYAIVALVVVALGLGAWVTNRLWHPIELRRELADAALIEFTDHHNWNGFWFPSHNQGGSARSFKNPQTSVRLDGGYESLPMKLVHQRADSSSEAIVNQVAAEANVDDPSHVFSIMRIDGPFDQRRRLAAATMLMGLARDYARFNYKDQSDAVSKIIVVCINRYCVLIAWPHSEIPETGEDDRCFFWPKDGDTLCAARIGDLEEAIRGAHEWHKPVGASPVILLCGEIPTIVLRAEHEGIVDNQWQKDIALNAKGERLTEADFSWTSRGPIKDRLTQLAKDDRFVRLAFRGTLQETASQSSAAGSVDKKGEVSDPNCANEFAKLEQACSMLEPILHELKVDERRRELVVLPYVQ